MLLENGLPTSFFKRNTRITTIFSVLVILMPILNSYKSPISVLGLGEFSIILLLPFMLFSMLYGDKKIHLHKYWLFALYSIICSYVVMLFNDISLQEINNRLLRIIFYTFIIFIFGINFFDYKLSIKIYKYTSLLTCIFLILQCISYNIFDFIIPWKIPGLDFNILISTEEYYRKYYAYFRPTSFFTEPAHFVHYCSPYLAIILFSNSRHKMKEAIFISFAILLSSSVNGFIFVSVIWIIWFFHSTYTDKRLVSILFRTMIIALIPILFIVLYNKSNSFMLVINRLNNISNDVSAIVRLANGFFIFYQLETIYKFFGIGFGSYNDFKILKSINLLYDTEIEYMSSLSYILVSSGIFGFILYMVILFEIYRKAQKTGKVLIILLIIMFMSSSIYPSPIYVIILLFTLYADKKQFKNVKDNKLYLKRIGNKVSSLS